MSLKSIDLQLAVHKNNEAGQLQNRLQQKPVQDQADLAGAGQKLVERQRNRSAGLEKSASAQIKDQGRHPGKGGRQTAGSRKREPAEDKSAAEHPYKGHHIDLSL